MKLDINKNPWSKNDEKEHPESVLEWWCIECFFKTVEDNKNWSLKTGLNEWDMGNEIGSIFNQTLFDEDENKHIVGYIRNEESQLISKKDLLHVQFDECYIKGSYPDYELYFNDKQNKIKLKIFYHAESLPRWVAQEVTDGLLPMGMGFYRYGFIPKCKVTGTMEKGGKTYHIKGKGYYEHVWGDFWYDNPFSGFSDFRRTIRTYSKLIGWWIRNHRIKIPKSLAFSTENNPFGYDWTWGVLDNGWALFYGNILFWLTKGPVAGTLILTKDGLNYEEFGDISFKYNKMSYSKEYDFYYPTDYEIIARKNEEILHLRFTMTTDPREYNSKFSGGKYFIGFVIVEAPGKIKGYYFDGENKVDLSGNCKIEPQRQASVIGHNSLKINITKPPVGVGVSFDFESHFLRRKMFTNIQLAPIPKVNFNIKKIKNKKINKNKLRH